MIGYQKLSIEQKEFVDKSYKLKEGITIIEGHAGSGKSTILAHKIRNILKEETNKKIYLILYTHSLIDIFIEMLKDMKIELEKSSCSSYNLFNYKKNNYNNKEEEYLSKNALNNTGDDKKVQIIVNSQQKYKEIKNKNIITIITVASYLKKRFDDKEIDYAFVDELQDLTIGDIKKINKQSKITVLSGDFEQMMYGKDKIYQLNKKQKKDFKESVEKLAENKIYKLNEVFRVNKKIIRLVDEFLKEENGPGNENSIMMSKINKTKDVKSKIKKIKYNSKEEEMIKIIKIAKESIKKNYSTVILVEYKQDAIEIMERGGEKKLFYLGSGINKIKQLIKKNKIIIMTYHSAKGLEFDTVIMPKINDYGRNQARKEKMKMLIMIGFTRSKKNLIVTHTGNLNESLNTKEIENMFKRGNRK
jgi:superfamily I DNA/RNA helicase